MAHSPQFLKKRKFLLALPLLTLPFITLAFWALGPVAGQADKTPPDAGFNANLPGARQETEVRDKMSMYAESDKDSLAFREQLRMDPYARQPQDPFGAADSFGDASAYSNGLGGYQYQSFSDPNEAKIQRKLAELGQAIQEPEDEREMVSPESDATAADDSQQRLTALLQAASGAGGQQQEMDQINSMLEKLIDVQNPGRVAEKLRAQSQRNRGRVFSVSRQQESRPVDLLSAPPLDAYAFTDTTRQQNSFYDLARDFSFEDTLPQTGIPAVVHETQVLVSGAAIKLRLTADVYVSGERIPAGSFVSGTCSIDGERLKVDITAIRNGKNIYPVFMMAYDLDAIEGIRIPGAISRDAAKDGMDRSLQSLQLMSLNPSLTAQAAGAGVEVAKGFLGKKAKQVRVTVKAGHPLLLVDAKTKQGAN